MRDAWRTIRTTLRDRDNPFLRFAAPGHFYSPIPSSEDVLDASRRPIPRTLPGIDTADSEQLALLQRMRDLGRPDFRRYRETPMFVLADALALAGMLRQVRPRHYLEVGSGYSSAVALDTNDSLDRSLSCTFIEPYPARLHALLSDEDRRTHSILEQRIQDVDRRVFDRLQANDVLFIDSSHVVKLASDVVYLLTEIVPSLPSGVLVHIHDIRWPFEYWPEWLTEGRAWNETYLVKAMLQHSRRYEMLLFNDYLGRYYPEALDPSTRTNPGGSLWLRVR
ncbi:MAG TPA: class I SAM-dependent methyltransferase [Vicinamibacterales bacterium]|nr:class I SAM-dependent methyltransferase [Vicinamibacterales bacterium]